MLRTGSAYLPNLLVRRKWLPVSANKRLDHIGIIQKREIGTSVKLAGLEVFPQQAARTHSRVAGETSVRCLVYPRSWIPEASGHCLGQVSCVTHANPGLEFEACTEMWNEELNSGFRRNDGETCSIPG